MTGSSVVTVPMDAPLAMQFVHAVHNGGLSSVRRLVSENPDLVTARFEARGGTRASLHLVADWPGYFPDGPQIATVLIDSGADPNATTTPAPAETPLHWVASSDDAHVASALIDGGANLETPNGSIGTPLDNAVGYGCWNVARLLVARGAKVDRLWHAAALGMLDRLADLLASTTEADQISQGFWHACAAGQRRAAELLLNAGADMNWEPDYAEGTALDAAHNHGTQRSTVIDWLTSKGARSARQTPGRRNE